MPHILSLAEHYLLPFIAVISVVVFVHEFGHYWVARRCGIRVLSFSIGFGAPLFSWTDKHGTRWQVAWLPLGGYVKMFGDTNPASVPDESVKEMTEEEKKVSFFYQPVNKRIAVVAAGPAFNYLFAILVLSLLFMFQGERFSTPVISELQENGVAAHAGLLPGDKIVSIDGEHIDSFEDIQRIISLNAGTPVSFAIERNNAPQVIDLTPEVSVQTDRIGGEHHMGKIGIVSKNIEYKKWPPLTAVKQATIETWKLSASTLRAVGQMILGARASDEIGGPLRIAQMSSEIVKDGFFAFVWFMAIISINLGLVNLFPVPLLDGGHLLFYTFEKLFGHPLTEKTQEVGFRIGLTLVVCLMVFATWNDLVHLGVISSIRALFS